MRFAPSLIAVLVLASASSRVARADSGLSLDFGFLHDRIAVTDQTALDGQFGRFGIRIMKRYFHGGVEAEEGYLTGSTMEGYVARGPNGGTGIMTSPSPLGGNTMALKMIGGAHADLGAVMVGADLAYGFRDTYVSSDYGDDVAGRKNEPLLEARTRLDFWLSRSFTLGVTASTDLREQRDTSFGAILAIHFENLHR